MSLSDSSPQLPRTLSSQYTAEDRIACQPGKETWLARDRLSNKPVIIKLLLFNPNFDWQNHKLFEREAQILKTLSHPQIPKFLDLVEFEDQERTGFALVQSYLEGLSLAQHLKNGRTFSDGDLKELARQVLGILCFLHTRKPPVIHRDIKPSNIIVRDRSGNSLGDVFLVDFGAVQTLITPGSTKTVVGTYGFMPPEQFGDRTLPASDLYSLGATLIFLSTGEHPANLPQRNLKLQFEPLVQMNSDLIRWIKKLVEPGLDKRFASAEVALNALDNPNLMTTQANALSQPKDSRIQLTKTSDKLHIYIPASGFQPTLVFLIPFAIAWNSFIFFWSFSTFAIPFPGNLFFLLFSLPFWTVGLGLIASILFAFGGQYRCQIDPTQIKPTLSLFGIPLPWPRPSSIGDVTAIEFVDAYWKRSSNGGRTRVPPKLKLQAGATDYQIGQFMPLKKAELLWLAEELSQWLDVPITEEKTDSF